jgi:hypothetical protein
LQGNRSTDVLTNLLSLIADDIADDGLMLNDSILCNLRASCLKLDLPKVRANIKAHYETTELGANIPSYEKYVAGFVTFTATKPDASTESKTSVTTTSATLWAHVNPNSALTEISFEYGQTDAYGESIVWEPSPINDYMFHLVNQQLKNLEPGTTYHYRIRASNVHGITYGEDKTFKTKTE